MLPDSLRLPPDFQAASTEERFAEKKKKADLADEEGRGAVRDAVFDKGQSRRIWGELYKVVDSSDVIIQVRGPGWVVGWGGWWVGVVAGVGWVGTAPITRTPSTVCVSWRAFSERNSQLKLCLAGRQRA